MNNELAFWATYAMALEEAYISFAAHHGYTHVGLLRPAYMPRRQDYGLPPQFTLIGRPPIEPRWFSYDQRVYDPATGGWTFRWEARLN